MSIYMFLLGQHHPPHSKQALAGSTETHNVPGARGTARGTGAQLWTPHKQGEAHFV